MSAELTEDILETLRTQVAAAMNWAEDPEPRYVELTGYRADVYRRAMEASEEYADTPPSDAAIGQWNPVDIADVLDSDPESGAWPEILTRDEKNGLFYPGLSHLLYGESESGKSWAALCATAEVLASGGSVLYIDFESDARTILGRLIALGAQRDALIERFTYLRPEAPLSIPDDPGRYRLAVMDGMTDAYMVYGKDQNNAVDVAHMMRNLVRPIMDSTGAAIVMVDHVTKSSDSRGRFPQGSQNKLSAITGAAYLVEPKEPLGAGMKGVLSLRVTKDRPGRVRATAGPYRASDRTQEAARLEIDSTGDGTTYTVLSPAGVDSETGEKVPFRATVLMDRITEYLTHSPGSTASDIASGVVGQTKKIKETLATMVTDGLVRKERRNGKGGGFIHSLTEPSDEPAGPGIFNN